MIQATSNSEEDLLRADHRLQQSIQLFNTGQWYACHDGFEELWHETQGPMRPVLQGILQIAVAHLHLERGNTRGATVLLGEGLGRLQNVDSMALGLNVPLLRQLASDRLRCLQAGADPQLLPLPELQPAAAGLPRPAA